MAFNKLKKLILGIGDLTDNTQKSSIEVFNTRPTAGDGDDGDIWIVVKNGAPVDYDILQKASGVWISLAGRPNESLLVDGQLTDAVGFQFPDTISKAYIRYTITRGSGGRIQQGLYTVRNNGGSVSWDEEFGTFGGDVNVEFQGFQVVGGQVQWIYRSTLETSAISLKWHIEGWE